MSSDPAINRAGTVAADSAAGEVGTAIADPADRAAAGSAVVGPDRAGRAADSAADAEDHPAAPAGRADPVSGVGVPNHANPPGPGPTWSIRTGMWSW